tara:strand:+ start:7081 stop:7680 length:600 start_codon:yes stop_codon:yes gene_type:complete
MIAIIDYKCGNIASVKNIIKKAGSESIITSNSYEINNCDKIILPGVGSFDYGMKKLQELKLIDVIQNHSKNNKPILGICLGMQLMAKCSEEGVEKGLSLFDAEVLKFNNKKGFPIPHMGWNTVDVKKQNPLIRINQFNKFYFVHSYYFKCNNNSDILSTTLYSKEFVSSVSKKNIYGVQFHPEKSHKHGLSVIKNFIKL